MNEIINWIALNNTLMIKSGFTAVLILLIVYIYRMIFVPKINVVAAAAASESNESLPKHVKEDSLSEREMPVGAEAAGAVSADEREKLLTADAPATQASSAAQAPAAAAAAEQARAAREPVSTEQSAANREQVESLTEKITKLENRLAEYEIIAEDISEISQLRSENAELKQRLEGVKASAEPSSVTAEAAAVAAEAALAAAAAEEPPIEIISQETMKETVGPGTAAAEPLGNLADSLDAALAEMTTTAVMEEAGTAEVAEPEPVAVVKPIELKTDTGAEVQIGDQELLSQFETMLSKKGS